jgi:hypothetical protein
MADVTKIPGPMPSEPNRESREVKPGTDKFRDFMKVGESGERQKKKKKRQDESEEDTKAELRTGSKTPERVPDTKKAEEFKKIQKIGESEKRQSMAHKRAEEAEAAEEAAAQINQKKIESLNLDLIQSAALDKKSSVTSSYMGELQQKEIEEEEVKAAEEKGEDEGIKIQRKVKKDHVPTSPVAPPPATPLGPLFIAPAPDVAPAYMQLNSEMLALFEKMTSQIFIMQTNGINETTINLNTPEFASSRFFGAQIVIKEYSTAPLAFNIEFLGSPQNSLYFEQNIASLRAAFAGEERKYSIHRIESRLSKQEKPLFRRKEKSSGKGKKDS